jgi:hypothetical protein
MRLNLKTRLALGYTHRKRVFKGQTYYTHLIEESLGYYNNLGYFYGISREYLLFEEDLCFKISNLRISRTNKSINQVPSDLITEIYGDLDPSRDWSKDDSSPPRYSNFLSSKIIEDFGLNIKVSISDDQETCTAYQHNEKIQVILNIAENRLNEYVRLIENDLIYYAYLTIKGVPGFYSSVGASLTFPRIKVLGSQKVVFASEMEDDGFGKISRDFSDGVVEEFEVELVTHGFDSTKLGKALNTIQKQLTKLGFPIWIIVLGVLVLLWILVIRLQDITKLLN